MVKPESTKSGAERVRERDPLTLAEKQLVARGLTNQLASITNGRQLALDEARALGAKDSAHDVFFIKSQKTEHNKRFNFAVKRFRRLASAEKEMEGMVEAKRRGFSSLEPVGQGIYPAGDIGHMLVTQHVPRFTTMNYLGWRNMYAGQEDYERRMAQPLRRIGAFAAKMHSAGILHGDFQLKNIAQGQNGEFLLFDLEDATFEPPEEINNFDFVSRAGDDVGVLISSMVKRGFLWDANDDLFEREVTNNLIYPYMENTAVTDTDLLVSIERGFEQASVWRTRLHSDFSSRIGLPS